MLNNVYFHPPKLEIGKRDNVAKSVAGFLFAQWAGRLGI
jgi:hypothetical protein